MAEADLFTEARDALRGAEPERALEMAEAGLAAAPRDGRLHLIAANASLRLRRVDDALSHLRAAVRIKPRDFETWRKLADLTARRAGPEEAIALLREAYGARPGPELRRLLSERLHAAGRGDEADALRPDPLDADGLLDSADAELEACDYEAAAADYGRALALRPDDPRAVRGLAQAHQYRGEWAEAIERWRQAVALSPEDHFPQVQLANVLRLVGEVEEAERVIQRAMVLQEAQVPRRFWGETGAPHGTPEPWSLAERTERALADQARCMVRPGSPYHPSRPMPFDERLQAEMSGGASSVLQYPEEVAFLARFLHENGVRSFFEVGMRHGGLAALLDGMLGFERIGGSEFEVTPILRARMADPKFDVYEGDHHAQAYLDWRAARGPYDFVFIDAAHGYNDALRDYLRESRLRPRFIGFHDVWNTGFLGAKRQWDELPGKIAYHRNEDPAAFMMVRSADKNRSRSFYDVQRRTSGYCCGIGVVELA